MTNDERIQKRIERDKQRRIEKHKEQSKGYVDIQDVFTMKHAVKCAIKCQKGVNFKGTVQKYMSEFLINTYQMVCTVNRGEILKLKNSKKETIRERGKVRTILPIVIHDRVLQKVVCNYSLIPLIRNKLIYDNCASLQGKGVNFARERLDKFLIKAVKQWDDDFYILVTDFKDYFGSIPHKTCYIVLSELYPDNPEMIEIIMKIIRSYYENDIKTNKYVSVAERERLIESIQNNEHSGICLGSQVSQMIALLAPDKLDHYVKDKCGVKFYIRYMDDSIVIHKDKEYLEQLYQGMKEVVESLGLSFNEKKTHIIKATKGFRFLKIYYTIDGHKIIREIDHNSIARERRKLKKIRKLVDENILTYDDAYNSLQAWLSHTRYATHSYQTVQSMFKLYDELFGGYKITPKYFKETTRVNSGGKRYEILQSDKWSEFHWNRNI